MAGPSRATFFRIPRRPITRQTSPPSPRNAPMAARSSSPPARRESLRAGAEKYLAAIGVILGFHIVEMGELRFSGPAARLGCSIGVVVGLALLFAAFVVALQSMRVRERKSTR